MNKLCAFIFPGLMDSNIMSGRVFGNPRIGSDVTVPRRGLSWSSSRLPLEPLEGGSWGGMRLNPEVPLEGASWSQMTLNPQVPLEGASWSQMRLNPEVPLEGASWSQMRSNPQVPLEGTSWSQMTLPSSSAFPLSDGLNGPFAPRSARAFVWSDLRATDPTRPSSAFIFSDARFDPTRPSSAL